MSAPTSFSGSPAGSGPRLIAFTIDVVLVAVVALAGGLLVSPALGAALAAEALLGLWIMQARLGSTPGAVLLGLRISRDDAPFSPGAGRAFVRGFLLLMGALVLVAGAWVLVASSAWDRSGRRRSWIDKASETVVVAVPARAQSAPEYALATPTVLGRSSSARPLGAADAGVSPVSELPMAAAWGEAAFAPPALPVAAATAPPSPAPVPQAAPVTPAAAPAPVAMPVPPASVSAASGQLLMVFDTGQREQFDLPIAVNLGRSPVATEVGDALVVVQDPDRMVSKTHLRLEHDGENAWVTDAGSTNGSELVDEDGIGRPLAPGVRTRLDDGVRVRVGERIFTVSRLIGGPA